MAPYPDGTRPAAVEEYLSWLRGHVLLGGEVTHYYDRPFKTVPFRIAYKYAEISRVYGEQAYTLIVPHGIRWSAPQGLGHVALCTMSDYRATNSNMIAVFNDPHFNVRKQHGRK